jgi:hypothetical protein
MNSSGRFSEVDAPFNFEGFACFGRAALRNFAENSVLPAKPIGSTAVSRRIGANLCAKPLGEQMGASTRRYAKDVRIEAHKVEASGARVGLVPAADQ